MSTPTIFISYCHQDEKKWQEEVLVHLQGLNLELDVWSDDKIGASRDWQAEINAAIDRAAVAVLLVTAHFLVSKFIKEDEVPLLLKRQDKAGLAIVPIIVMPCSWKRYPWLARIQVRPKDGRALRLRKDGTEASAPEIANDLTSVAEEVGELMDQALLAAPPPAPPAHAPPVAAPVAASPDLAAVADSATQTDAAVRTVTAAAGNAATGDLLGDFETTFRDTATVIAAITGYKELHDELHTLELDVFSGILNDYTRITTDAGARELLALRASELLETIHQVRAIAQGLPVFPGGLAWIDRLVRAHALLLEAIETQSAARATSAVTLINGVLDTQPGLLNEQIVAHTRKLDFDPLHKAIETVRKQLGTRQGAPAPRVQELLGQADAILRLEEEFSALVEKHNAWQGIERSLRTIETSIAASFEQLEFLWPSLRDDARPLFSPPAAQWERDLSEACIALDTLIQANDPLRVAEARKRFREFRRRSGIRFLKVDEELRDACARLSRVGESLQVLLRMLETL